MMIEVVISADVAEDEGLIGIIKRLRDNGIPVRVGPNHSIRLCQVWMAPIGARLGEGKLLGYGRLESFTDHMSRSVTFRYWAPVVEYDNTIDVEARVVTDESLLGSTPLQLTNSKT